MIIPFIKGKKLSKPAWHYVKMNSHLLLTHEKTMINPIILES